MKLSAPSITAVTIAFVTGVTAGGLWLSDTIEQRNDNTPPPDNDGGSSVSIDVSSETSVILQNCADDDQSCYEKAILDLSINQGPVESIGVLNTLMAAGKMHGRGDYHDFVHRIGRNTAKKFGLNPDGFFLCPIDYNYGCQHGFFEQALVEQPNAKLAAETVCDPALMTEKPLKFLFYCYHGVGHGIMMAKAYDLHASLDVCEEFSGEEKLGCYQGVFMENVVGYQNGTARTNIFSETDRLAPCRDLDKKYHEQCYMNHGGYLIDAAGKGEGVVKRATDPCLTAGDAQDVRTCLQSVALNATNPGWQAVLLPNTLTDNFIANAVTICQQFPSAHIGDCVIAAVNNLGNFYRTDTTYMVEFCSTVDVQYRNSCFRQIGIAVHHEVTAQTTGDTICAAMPEEYRTDCLTGFSL